MHQSLTQQRSSDMSLPDSMGKSRRFSQGRQQQGVNASALSREREAGLRRGICEPQSLGGGPGSQESGQAGAGATRRDWSAKRALESPYPECGCVRVCVRASTDLQPVVNPSCLGIKTLPCNLNLLFPLDTPSLRSPCHF